MRNSSTTGDQVTGNRCACGLIGAARRPWCARAALLLLLVAAVMALATAPALAKEVHVLEKTFGAGELALAEFSGLAANQETGELYVADTGNARVVEFAADGTFEGSFAASGEPTFIAVDNSAGGGGDIYVGDVATDTVSKYTPAGVLVASWGAAGKLSFSEPLAGVAVDPSGNLWVYSENVNAAGQLREYSRGGAPVSEFEVPVGVGRRGIAVDSADNLYVVRTNPKVQKVSASGEFAEFDECGEGSGCATGVGVDPADDDVYVGHETGFGGGVVRYSSSGTVLEPSIGAGELEEGLGVPALGPAHVLYVTLPGTSEIAVFAPTNIEPPAVTLEPASAITPHGAHLLGTVDPEGDQTTCRFEYVTQTHFEAEEFAGAETLPCEPQPGGGTAPKAVATDVTGLVAGTAYRVRLVASNRGGEGVGGPIAFSTVAVPPEISAPSATDVTGAEATLGVVIDPGGAPTEYHFEYLTEAQYRADGSQFGPGTLATPSPPAVLAERLTEAQAVSSAISGLVPATEYRFRAVATNTSPGDPTVTSEAKTFLTVGGGESGVSSGCPNETLRAETGSLELPDCRAYEQVTPAFKNGAVVKVDETFLAPGPRLETEAQASFAGTQTALTLAANYESIRSTTGWGTTPILPSTAEFKGAENAVENGNPLYALATGGRNLFGLREPGKPIDGQSFFIRQEDGTFSAIGPSAPVSSLIGPRVEGPVENQAKYFIYRLTDDSLSSVLYQIHSPRPGAGYNLENDYLWPFDRTAPDGFQSAYEYAGSAGSEPFLVGVSGSKGSSALISGCGTSFGSFSGFGETGDEYNALSANGSTVFFTPSGEDQVGSCPGPVGAPPTSQLFARVDGETAAAHTVAISEPTTSDCAVCQTPLGSGATFQGASEDGSKVFFLTSGELLPGNPGENLYEYDFGAPAGEKVTALSHLASGASAGVRGVVRVSEDGSHVYFVAGSVLTAEPNSTGAVAREGEDNMYVYDTANQSVGFVASLSPADESDWSISDVRREAEATPDGRFLLFASVADLTPDDTSSVSQLFRFDADDGELVRISVGRDGYGDNGNTRDDPVQIPARFTTFAGHKSSAPQLAMSDDGSYVFFESSKALTPRAVDHESVQSGTGALVENIYGWHDGAVSLISRPDRSAAGAAGSRSAVHLLGTDASGEDVFFTTANPLIPSDHDENEDVYDARIDGGFAPGSSPVCSGEACQPPAVAAIPQPGASSAELAGPSNPHPHRRRRHKRRRHHRHGRPSGHAQRRRSTGHGHRRPFGGTR